MHIYGELKTQNSELETLAARYPRTIAAFSAMGALDHLDRIMKLDQTWNDIRSGSMRKPQEDVYTLSPIASHPLPIVYDLIYAGGGLGLLHAVVMAQHGYRVMLFDRGEVGCAHREWNISREELGALIEVGFCTWTELDAIVMAEYDAGVVRFHAPDRANDTELCMAGVLNVALDAGALLRLARRKLAAAGGIILDRRTFRGVVVQRARAGRARGRVGV